MPKPSSTFHLLPSTPRVAIVHDWLIGGGAERVVLELHNMFPDAPIYTSYCTDEWRKKLDGKVVTGVLQRWPFSKLYKFLPVLRIWWFSTLKFNGYDLVISSSGNGEAKGVKVPKGTKHVCYCHSPTHFYWRHHQEYLANPKSGFLNPVARLGLKLLIGPLRQWDKKAASRPDYIIANSTHIQSDIKKYYGRDSVVIHPPVDTKRFQLPSTSFNLPARKGFVTVGRQVPYKRVDLIVDACTQLNLPLTVIGRGPEHSNLVKRAGPTVSFIFASDEEVVRHMGEAEAFIMAAFEDFGITPVEAMAAGTPVIAYKAGGALDYVTPGLTGTFFTEQTAESLAECLKSFDASSYDSAAIQKAAQNFSVEQFHNSLKKTIESILS